MADIQTDMQTVDLCGPLPETTPSNTKILVIDHHFTRRYNHLRWFSSHGRRVLEECIFCYFGVSEEVHSDLGRQFESQLLR